LIGLVWSFLYVGTIVLIGEAARRFGLARFLTRKVIHVGVGLWIWGTLALFDSPVLAAVPPLLATIGNALIHRFRLLKAVEAPPENLGTIWFPISFAALILLLGDRPYAVAAGIMAMTFGDALAALIGERFGRRRYQIGRATKSLEGSLVMLVVSFVAIALTLWAFVGGWFRPRLIGSALGAGLHQPAWGSFARSMPPAESPWLVLIGLSILAAVYALCAEAVGSRGLDNLWVPVGVALLIAYVPAAWAFQLGLGALLATFVGLAAWAKGALTPSGVGGAILTGTLLFGYGGLIGAAALLAFFLSSSLLSHRFKEAKRLVEADYAKGGTRDFGQAMANGGIAALAALLLGLTGHSAWLGAMVGALAAANADTWATELGVLARRAPRLVTTLRPVPKGTSGGVTLTGLAAAAGGGVTVGLAAILAALLAPFVPLSLPVGLPSLRGIELASALAVPATRAPWPALFALVVGASLFGLVGLFGSLVDSLLGATLQAIYWCPQCGRETERTFHSCGVKTRLHRGVPWVENDLVNLLATATGAILGYLLLL
jgi:uncharacterized protein (TIGR00297 family)